MTSAPLDGASGYWYAEDAKTQQGVDILNALRQYRAAEIAMRRRTRTSMGMGETDILAIRYLVEAQRAGRSVTAKGLADRLQISTPSTTALIDRLERSGHVRRERHPTDRRAVVVVPTDSTHDEVRHTLGSMHERMIAIAEGLESAEAEAVVAFLDAMRSAVDEIDADDGPAEPADGMAGPHHAAGTSGPTAVAAG